MESIYRLSTVIHIAAGTVALAAFWVPLFARKGGPVHRRAGWIYLIAMAVSVGLATGMVALLLAAPAVVLPQAPPAEVRRFASFLIILPLLTLTGAWQGIGALRGFAGSPLTRAVNGVLVAAGVVELALAVTLGSFLHGVFGVIALVSARGNLGWARRKAAAASPARARIAEHLTAMLATGIAVHTAFLLFGARRIVPGLAQGSWVWLLWVAPTVVGVLAGLLWSRRVTMRTA